MKTLARVTLEDLREVVKEAVEKKLTEVLGDPDEGRPLRAGVQRRLRRSLRAGRRGEKGIPAEPVARKYGLRILLPRSRSLQPSWSHLGGSMSGPEPDVEASFTPAHRVFAARQAKPCPAPENGHQDQRARSSSSSITRAKASSG